MFRTHTNFIARRLFPMFAAALLFAVLSPFLHAQMQYNQWAFGWRASYNFSTSGPLTPAPLITSLQDAASWCDNTGNMMFYTDGKSIFNQVGPGCTNCMNGNPNGGGGTQGALILPRIGGPANEFYIFTVSDKGATPPDVSNGLSYYTFNSTSGALSTVTSMGSTAGTTGSFTSEGLTAIPHANGVDYWIIVKAITTATSWISSPLPPNQPVGANNNSVYAYLVTAAGVSPNPVISNGNYSIIVSGVNAGANVMNEIKCSPDGRYVSITNRTSSTSGNTNLYRFNSATGTLIFLQQLPMAAGYATFGSSFSPNSKLLYVCGSYPAVPGVPGDEVVRQYNLADVNCDPFATIPFCDYSCPVPFSAPASFNTQMQLTPDGRIFRTRYSSQTIDVISTPNMIGCANIGYIPNGVVIANVAGNSCRMGLPNNIDAQVSPPAVDEWPKTTTNTMPVDNGVSTDADEFGNVYSTGTFQQSTQFESTVITGGGIKSTYLVKYSPCNGMLWVAKAVAVGAADFVTCNSMDVGENVSRVFVTGRYKGTAVFTSAAGVLCPGVPINITGNGIFIAVYNYSGCLLGVNTIPDDPNYTHSSAHVNVGRGLNPMTGIVEDRVYVAVNEVTLLDNRMRIFSFAITGPGTLSNVWIAPLRSSPNAQINDIASSGTRLAVTGTYERDIFWNTDVTSFATTPTGVFEAFVATLEDVNGFVLPTKIAAQTRGFDLGSGSSSSSGGQGVHLAGSSVFITGSYRGTNTSAFGTGTLMSGNGSNQCGYAVRLDAIGTGWAHTFSCGGPVEGLDVITRTGVGAAVYFTGMWESDNVFDIDYNPMPAVVPGKKHMYVVKMLLNGTFTGASCWQNYSYVNNDATDIVKPARLALFGTRVYVNGTYKGTAQMNADAAFNSPLTSTPGTLNSFVWRFSEPNGISFRQGNTEAEVATESQEALKLFPNPVSGTLNIQIPLREESTAIEIYNSSGQLLLQMNTQNTIEQIDVASWASGIYFIRTTYGEEVKTEKFMRE